MTDCQNCKHFIKPVFYTNRPDDCFNSRFKRKPKCKYYKYDNFEKFIFQRECEKFEKPDINHFL